MQPNALQISHSVLYACDEKDSLHFTASCQLFYLILSLVYCFSGRFLTCILTCCPVSILICLRLNLSAVHNLSLHVVQ